jgi:hypothetical protein
MTPSSTAPAPETAPTPGWQEWATRTTAVLAVLAALSSGQWGAANLRAILEQGKVDDGWAYYQSKSIKNHLAEHMRDLAQALSEDLPAKDLPGRSLAAYGTKMGTESNRLSAEKAILEQHVRGYEKHRDEFVERSFWYEIAFAFLQVGVVLSTIASAARKRVLWIIAISAGLAGGFFVLNGMGHFIKTPVYAAQAGPQMGIEEPLRKKTP